MRTVPILAILVALPGLLAVTTRGAAAEEATKRPPNVVIILCDDLGYGDLGCYGHPTIRTPHLDRMAREGQKWTNFYVGACVCTPSRAALMTGRLAIRSGMTSSKRRVLFPDSAGGLPGREVTMAEALKGVGYATACVGKWHLGHLPQYLPTRNGFDQYFGVPYSNDMDRVADAPQGQRAVREPKNAYFNVPLMRDEQVIERPADQATLTKRYTAEAVRFIEANRARPFFLYLAHNMPHVPLFRSPPFAGTSRRGVYGDVVEELDASVGRVLDAVRRNQLAENTVVFFSSDNGPWLIYDQQGGSAGLLRDGKGSTWEGGMREPFLAWWPGTIASGTTVADMGSTMDLYVTVLKLAGAEPPRDRILDGGDLRPALFGNGPSPREVMFYYRDDELYAVRKGPFKAHFVTKPGYGDDPKAVPHDPPLLYNLDHDPSEQFDVAGQHPDVVSEIRRIADEHRRGVERVENQLEGLIGKD
jgi:arylsulfatase A-like enzyme